MATYEDYSNDFLVMMLNREAAVWEQQFNALAEADYLEAAKQWASRKVHGSEEPPPVAPFAIDYQVVDFGIVRKPTAILVSRISPQDFLPTYRTDIHAAGGPVGGPIEGSPGHFYATSSANPHAGDIHRIGADIYVYQKPMPFGGYWVKL